MAKPTKHHISALIRSGKPAVHADKSFITQLQNNLQHRAAELTPRVYAQREAQPRRSPWLWLSSLSLGGVALAVAAMLVLPNWLNPNTGLTGYIQKGPFISGSTITIQELDDQLQPTGTSYQVTTASDFGDYRLNQAIKSDYVEVIADGFYYNEVSGELSAAPLTLRAIAAVSGENQPINVNLLTSLTAPRLRHIVVSDDTSFVDAKHIAEQEVLSIFQITEPNINDFEAMNISQAGINNGILLAVSVMLQGQQSVAELSELLSKLSLAIRTDGSVEADGPLLETIRTNASQLNTSAIRTNLKERFKEVGEPGTVPDFEQWLKPFTATADPFSYRLTLLDNVFGVNRTAGATIKTTIYGNGFIEGQEWVSLKNTLDATAVQYIDDHTLVATFPIETLSAGSYTVVVKNTETGRTGVTDGVPLEDASTATVAEQRLILRGLAPTVEAVTGTVSYVDGGTINLVGENFAYGSFVWINDWQVPDTAVTVMSSSQIKVDLSSALITAANLPRKIDLTLTVQTPDFQTTTFTGLQIQ